MALPQDQPNPVPEWAAGLKSPGSPTGPAPASAGGTVTVATPPPEYGIGVALYIHRAVADAFNTYADHVANMGTDVDPRTGAIHAARKIAEQHADTAARLGESLTK